MAYRGHRETSYCAECSLNMCHVSTPGRSQCHHQSPNHSKQDKGPSALDTPAETLNPRGNRNDDGRSGAGQMGAPSYKSVEIRSPNATRPWQHVLEPLSGYLSLAENLYLSKKNNEKIRFKWLEDDQASSYFEFRIQFDDITKDVSLIVTDFAEEDEMEESKMLWTNQISDLKKILGSS